MNLNGCGEIHTPFSICVTTLFYLLLKGTKKKILFPSPAFRNINLIHFCGTEARGNPKTPPSTSSFTIIKSCNSPLSFDSPVSHYNSYGTLLHSSADKSLTCLIATTTEISTRGMSSTNYFEPLIITTPTSAY